MEDGMDTNAANSIEHTADMNTQQFVVKQVTYAGNAAASRMLDRSLNQAADTAHGAHASSQSAMLASHDIAKQARFTNLSNRGA